MDKLIYSQYPQAKKYRNIIKVMSTHDQYELMGLLATKDIDTVLSTLPNIGLSSPVYDSERDAIRKETFVPIVEASGKRCKHCGSRETFSYQEQNRSADEGMTTHHHCSKCGKET